MGLAVASTWKGWGSLRVVPATDTCRSCIASSSADWVLGGVLFFFKQKTAYEIGLGIPAEPLPIFPKLRLILILNSFLGSSDSLVFSELFHSLAPRPLAARSISDFLLTYLAT